MGAAITLAQIALAVLLLAPEGSLSSRYFSLNQHDSYWFMNIVNRGYQTIVPPIDHKVMEVSNTAFFPAYPALAGLLRYGLGIGTGYALLIVAQLAAWGFWTYFFLLGERWTLSPKLQLLGALSIVSHPAAFFLVAGYSESLFLMALLGFVYWSTSEGRRAKMLAVLHGNVMAATRIVGIPCAMIPVLRSVATKGVRTLRQHLPAIAISVLSMFGAALFFVYCQLRWGHWNMYMLTQAAGWGIVPDYLAVLRPESYRWLVPALNDPREASQMSMTLGALMLAGMAVCEFVPAIRRQTNWQQRIGIYFAGAAIYFVSVSGVACMEMESMLRYGFSAHAVIVLAFLHFLRQCRVPPVLARAFGPAAVVLASVAGLSIQGWYVWNFTRGHWIA